MQVRSTFIESRDRVILWIWEVKQKNSCGQGTGNKSKISSSHIQVCIAFCLHRGMVVISKTVGHARITENLKATELELDVEDMKRLRELDRNFRRFPGELIRKSWESVNDLWDVQEDEKFMKKN